MSKGRGVCPGRSMCVQGGVCFGGVSREWGVSQHAMGQTPPPVNIITDRCKNTTLPLTSFAGGNNQEYLRQNLNDIHLS